MASDKSKQEACKVGGGGPKERGDVRMHSC